MEQKVRRFPVYPLTPHMHGLPQYQHPQQRVLLLQLMNLHRHISINQSPQFTLGFIWCCTFYGFQQCGVLTTGRPGKSLDFQILILYLVTLPMFLLIFNILSVDTFGTIILYVINDSFFISDLYDSNLFFLSCCICQDSQCDLNRSGKIGHPYLVFYLKGTDVTFLHFLIRIGFQKN